MKTKIVGAHFRPPAKPILAALHGDCPLELRPEPTNPHDPNAIAVWVATESLADHADNEALTTSLPPFGFTLEDVLATPEWHLGYVPRVIAEQIIYEFGGESLFGELAFDSAGAPCSQFTLPSEE